MKKLARKIFEVIMRITPLFCESLTYTQNPPFLNMGFNHSTIGIFLHPTGMAYYNKQTNERHPTI